MGMKLMRTSKIAVNDANKAIKVSASHNTDFGKVDYWEKRFEVEEEYDWLLTFNQLKCTLLPYLEDETYGGKRARILLVGVGNSTFSADLYDAGFTNLVNVDYSSVVIEKMLEAA